MSTPVMKGQYGQHTTAPTRPSGKEFSSCLSSQFGGLLLYLRWKKKKKNHTLSHHHKMLYDFTSPSKMGCSNKRCSNPWSLKKSNIIFVNLWGKVCIFLKLREMHNRYWELLSRLMVMKLLLGSAPHQQCENPQLAHCCHHSSLITLAANSSPPPMYWTPCFLYRVPISTSKPSFTLKPKWSAVQIQICHSPA